MVTHQVKNIIKCKLSVVLKTTAIMFFYTHSNTSFSAPTIRIDNKFEELQTINNHGETGCIEHINRTIFDSFSKNKIKMMKVYFNNEKEIKDNIQYNGTNYKTNLIMGSFLKEKKANIPLYAIENDKIKLKNFMSLMNHREGFAYSSRAMMFNGENSLLINNMNIMTFSDEDPNRVITLNNGIEIKIDDGWGYIRRSVVNNMMKKQNKGKVNYNKSKYLNGNAFVWHKNNDESLSNKLSHDSHNVIKELTKGISEHLPVSKNSVKAIYNSFTGAHIESDTVLVMPSPDNILYLPSSKYQNSSDISLFRNPADKFNFYPVKNEEIQASLYNETVRFISELDSFQYSLVGKINGKEYVFYKGVLGIIDDKLFPSELSSYSVFVNSNDRKLSENWSDLQDKESTHSVSTSFNFDGHLVATQIYRTGLIAAIPHTMMKFLSGDYDGDTVSIINHSKNLEFMRWVIDGYSVNKYITNPKVKKTFTPTNGEVSGVEQIKYYRSPLIGIATNITSEILSLPSSAFSDFVNRLQSSPTTKPDYPQDIDDKKTYVINELRTIIKEGTDLYKTLKDPQPFIARLNDMKKILSEIGYKEKHLPRIKNLLERCSSLVSVHPTLEHKIWRDIYFLSKGKNEFDEYLYDSIPNRIAEKVIYNMLPEIDKTNIEKHKETWIKERTILNVDEKIDICSPI